MPEGDTIRRLADRLGPLLVGRTVVGSASRWPAVVVGLRDVEVLEVRPIGKNLLIGLSDGTTLRVHLGMNGSWRWYAAGEPVRTSLGRTSLRLDVVEGSALCVDAPTVERVRTRELEVHPALGALGPDLLAERFDPEVAARAALASTDDTVAETLLNQRVACGIGNIYKCETLFVRRVDPFATPASLPLERWTELYAEAQRLLQANVGPGPRGTTGLGRGRPRYWVYGRGGRPCLRCGTRIGSRVHGRELPRTTWFCPRCQPQRVS